jgi:hypothetical protein
MKDGSETTTKEALADVIRRTCYQGSPLALETDDKAGKRRSRIHAKVARKVLEDGETVQFASPIALYTAPFAAFLGDWVLLLTERAIVTTWEPPLPVTFLSRATRREFTEVEAVSVEESAWPSKLHVDLRGAGSEVFPLESDEAAKEAAQLIRLRISAARAT